MAICANAAKSHAAFARAGAKLAKAQQAQLRQMSALIAKESGIPPRYLAGAASSSAALRKLGVEARHARQAALSAAWSSGFTAIMRAMEHHSPFPAGAVEKSDPWSGYA